VTTKTNIQYSYAQDESGKIIHINDVPLEYAKRGHYYSIEEGDEMIARKGEKVAWHFAHKDGRPGALETYLHKLGKSAFKQAFEESNTFNLLLTTPLPCSQKNICPIFEKKTCSQNKPYPFNLKQYYSHCELEKRITFNGQEFQADVCLIPINPEHDYLIIEIQVTHASTRKKRQSGLRIIEVEITKDSDIERFRQHNLSEQNGVRLYGFKSSPRLPEGVSTNNVHAFKLRKFQILKNKQIHISDYNEDCDNFASKRKWDTQDTLFYLITQDDLTTTQNTFDQCIQREFYNRNDFEQFARQRAFYFGFPTLNQKQFDKQFRTIRPSYTNYYIWHSGLPDGPQLINESEEGYKIINDIQSEYDPDCKLSAKEKSYWSQIIECIYEDNHGANIDALLGALYLAKRCKKYVQLVSPPAKEESDIDYWINSNERYFPILVDEIPDNLFS
jgi:hypothetical protein